MKVLAFALLSAIFVSAAFADNLKWATGKPLYISTKGPYIVYVEVIADGSRTFRTELRKQSTGQLISSKTRAVAGGFSGKMSAYLEFSEILTVGETYFVTNELLDGNSVVTTNGAPLEAVAADLYFANEITTIPAGQTSFNVEVVYTAHVASYFVVAVKEPTDTVYLGSARVYAEPGVNVKTTVAVRVADAGASLPEGQLAILRIDIRPADASANYRYDRIQRKVTATNVVVQPPKEYAVELMSPHPTSVHSCSRLTQMVSYEAPEGPNYIYLRVHHASGRKVKAKRIPNVPAGRGQIQIKMWLRKRHIEIGEKYEVRVDIRRMDASKWKDRLDENRRGILIPAVTAC